MDLNNLTDNERIILAILIMAWGVLLKLFSMWDDRRLARKKQDSDEKLKNEQLVVGDDGELVFEEIDEIEEKPKRKMK